MSLDFLDPPRTRMRTSAGEVELPVEYRDASALLAFFRVAHGPAAELLWDAPVALARFPGDAAIAALAVWDARDTSVGPCREVGLALAAIPRGLAPPMLQLLHLWRPRPHEAMGWYVLDLPVTSALADVAGRELWGFPKFATEVDVDLGEDAICVVVQAPAGEEPILTLQGRAGPGVAVEAGDLVLYTQHDGALLRVATEARGTTRTFLGRGLTLRLGGADHPMAHRLAALGLDGARPLVAQVCPRYRALLHAGVPFRAAAARAA